MTASVSGKKLTLVNLSGRFSLDVLIDRSIRIGCDLLGKSLHVLTWWCFPARLSTLEFFSHESEVAT